MLITRKVFVFLILFVSIFNTFARICVYFKNVLINHSRGSVITLIVFSILICKKPFSQHSLNKIRISTPNLIILNLKKLILSVLNLHLTGLTFKTLLERWPNRKALLNIRNVYICNGKQFSIRFFIESVFCNKRFLNLIW
ncbi:hypothetical protein GGTG_01682 [Gaeumannomyces tritici R3-111a-1]|uniref:Uncharacterized protein n=1 Tax=Gaeumannomyces tritici (strain R3-111a-1) TaxID=644352 RepID=J3NKA2_GAET3|nr:hypothetical protein GGTG_01682 [Gaeumannomyces tritici R3-111a-1]EJT81706.1 hypothetical protein GGTG_01682 [Gaeumannomyces tritici R3-111a-1]